nr:probable NEDD8-conjugating enzyme Ubc12-like isoform X1 [Malus domestica]
MLEECKISFPNGKDDLMDFEITITPYRGYYMGDGFVFTFKVPAVYPHEPPKVKCKTKIYHPNIDLEGNTCLNILREDWKPVLNINTVIYGLYHLFTEPNHEDPLNQEAADLLRDNPKLFGLNVRKSIEGNIWVEGPIFLGAKRVTSTDLVYLGFCFFVVQPWLYEVEGLYVFGCFLHFR